MIMKKLTFKIRIIVSVLLTIAGLVCWKFVNTAFASQVFSVLCYYAALFFLPLFYQKTNPVIGIPVFLFLFLHSSLLNHVISEFIQQTNASGNEEFIISAISIIAMGFVLWLNKKNSISLN